jgi:signal transduction histidine kinase
MPKKQLNSRLDKLFSFLNNKETASTPISSQTPPGWTWECGPQGYYVACSPEVSHVLGYSPEDFVGQQFQSFGLASQSIIKLLDVIRVGVYPSQVELYFQSRQGILIPIRMHIFVRSDPLGAPAGFRGFTQVIPASSIQPEFSRPAPSYVPPLSQPAAHNLLSGFSLINGTLQSSSAPWTEVGQESLRKEPSQKGPSVASDGTLAIPFSSGGSSRGVIEMVDPQHNHWSEDDRLLAKEVADQLALTLENAQLYAVVQQELVERERAEHETLKRNQDLAILNQIGQQLNRLGTPSEILETAFTGIGKLMNNSNLFIALYDQENQHISFPIYYVDGQSQIVAGHPFALVKVLNTGSPDLDHQSSIAPPDGTGLIEFIIQSQQSLLLGQNVRQNLINRGIPSFGRTAASLLAIPMLTAAKVAGVIVIQDFNKENAFTEIHSELLSTIASQATIALENANLFQQMQGALVTIEVRERYQKNVARAVATLTEFGTQSLADVLKILGEAAQTSRVYYVTAVSAPATDSAANNGSFPSWHIVSEWCDTDSPSLLSTTSSVSTEAGKAAPTLTDLPTSSLPFLVNELIAQGKISGLTAIMPPQERDFMQSLGIRSFLAIAVAEKSPIPGFIGFDEINYERPWGTEEIDALQMAAAALSNTLAREDLLDQLQASLDETENLYNASRRLAIANGYQEMLAAITEGFRISSINRGVLFLFDYDRNYQENISSGPGEMGDIKPSGLLVCANWHSGWGMPPVQIGIRFSSEAFQSCPRLNTPSPLFFDDMHQDDELTWTYPNIFDRDHTAGLAILPLWVGKRQMGVLLLQAESRYHFTERETRSYTSLLGQMAIAIENLRLFQQMQEALSETRALYNASQPLTSPKELSKLLQSLAEAVAQAIPAHQVLLEIFDIKTRQINYLVKGGPDPSPITPITFPELERGLVGWVIRERKPALSHKGIEDQREDPSLRARRYELNWGSMLVVPLLYQEDILGVVVTINLPEEPDFTPRDVHFMTAVANQVAIAVANTKLFEQTQHALSETEALYLASAEINLARTYEEILASLQKNTLLGENAQDISLCFFDSQLGDQKTNTEGVSPTKEGIQIAARITKLPITTFEHLYYLRSISPIQRLLHANQPTIIEDVANTTEFDDFSRQLFAQRFGAQSTIFLPLVIAGQWIGFINAIYQQPTLFPEEGIRRLVSLTNQAAVAVQNLRSIALTEKRAADAVLQFKAAQRLSQAQDETSLFRVTLEACASGVNAPSLSIHFVNYAYCEQAAHLIAPNISHYEDGTRCPTAEFPFSNLILLTGQMVTCSSIDKDSRLTQSSRQWLLHNNLSSVLFLPLQIRGHTSSSAAPQIALLVAGRTSSDIFTPAELTFFQTIITQLSIALDNVRLLKETQQLLSESRNRAIELQTAAEIARDTSSTLALDNLLNRVVNLISERFNLYQVSIFLIDDEGHFAIIREATGKAGEEMKRRGHRLPIAVGSSVVGTAIRTAQPVVVSDVSLSPIHRPNPLLPETLSEMAIPLRIGDRVIGALDVQSRQRQAFNENLVSVMQTLVDQIAVGIDNARSYELAQKAILEMREVDRLKSQFLANMSHELRTPLNSIIGFSRVILKGIDGPINETQQADLSAIYSSGQHLLKLINDILDLSKIDAGKMELNFEEVNMIDLINSVMSTAVGLVKDKPIKLMRNLPIDLPHVQADSTKIRQIILNLISNAAKFTDEGTITVEAGKEIDPNGKPEIYVRVTDTGPGIAEKDRNKLFQPFSQVDDSPTRKTGGTGLGLSICKSLIELHHGRIGLFSSEVGKGSTFFFSLPLPLAVTGPLNPNVVLSPDSLENKKTPLAILASDDDSLPG